MSLRSARACMVCGIIQTGSKFNAEGCPNCEDFLELRGSSEAVYECTSAQFEGVITLSGQTGSWVARWQRIEGYKPGVYAVKIEGTLPDEYASAAEGAGVKYIPRDGSSGSNEEQ